MSFASAHDILAHPQKALRPELAFATRMGFTMYGGTAIALRLGHRSSVDFDFFGAGPFNKSSILTNSTIIDGGQVIQDTVDTLTITTERGGGPVKVSFFGDLVPKRIAEWANRR